MPRRTLTVSLLSARGKRKHRDFSYSVDDIDGHDLLELFGEWMSNLDPGQLRNERNGHYTKIISSQTQNRSTFVVGAHGRFGTKGETVNVLTHEVDHNVNENQSPTVQTRFILTVPESGSYATFAVERQSNTSSAIAVMNEFCRDMGARFNHIFFDIKTMQVSDAWLENADLLSITAVQYERPVDPADGLVAIPTTAQFESTVRAVKGQKYLSPDILPGIRKGRLGKNNLLGFPLETYDELKVQVQHNGQTKTYNVEKEETPRFQFLLNEDGKDPLSNKDFVKVCRDQLQECYESLGLSWEGSWLTTSILDAKSSVYPKG